MKTLSRMTLMSRFKKSIAQETTKQKQVLFGKIKLSNIKI